MANGNGSKWEQLWKGFVQLGALGLLGGAIFGAGYLADKYVPLIVGALKRTAAAVESLTAKADVTNDLLNDVVKAQDQTLDIITVDPAEREPVRERIAEERERDR